MCPLNDDKFDQYTDEELSQLVAWLEDLTYRQLFFLKDSYESYLNLQAQGDNLNGYIH